MTAFVVALTELASPAEAEASALAVDIGATAYDARLLLAAGLPAVVKTTPDRAAATDLLARLRTRGHGAVAFDASAVVASADMVTMPRPRLADDAIEAGDPADARLPYEDVLALLLATHRRRTDASTETRETKLSMGRALMTGGMAFTNTVKTETHAATEEREAVLYLFRKSGETPWILREHGTAWTGLVEAGALSPSEGENFRRGVTALRQRAAGAAGAAFDDRLARRRATERTTVASGTGMTVKTSSEAGVDLLAHVLALWLSKQPPGA
jgi:hypothetical protein